MEIEKKYLLKKTPDNLSDYPSVNISQGYISTNPVIRIRQKNTQYYLTVKSKGLLAREEFEIEIKKDRYNHLSKKLDHNIVEKTRYLIPYEKYTIELDIFTGKLEGLTLAEVEFSSIEEAHAFVAPDWFQNEVTKDYRYHNSYLCQLDDVKDL